MRAHTGGAVNRLPSAARNSGWRSISRRVGPAPPSGRRGTTVETPRPGTTTTVFRTVCVRADPGNGIVVLVPVKLWAQRPGTLVPGTRSDFDQTLPNGVENGLGAVVDVELLVHVADVVAHGLLADLQLVRDLLVGHPRGQHLENLDLARREPVVELFRGRGAREQLENPIGDRAGHHPLAGYHRQDTGDDRAGLRVLEHVTAGAGFQRLDHVVVGFEGGQHQDFDLRVLGDDAAGRLDAVEVGHLDVHQHDVRLRGEGDLDRVEAIDGFADDGDAVIAVEQSGQSRPEKRLVVRDHHPRGLDRRGRSGWRLRCSTQISCSLGRIARTVVPPPATLSTSSRPPRITARSLIPSTPMPGSRAPAPDSTPRPSSLTSTAKFPLDPGPRATSTRRAPLCCRTFVRASSMMR